MFSFGPRTRIMYVASECSNVQMGLILQALDSTSNSANHCGDPPSSAQGVSQLHCTSIISLVMKDSQEQFICSIEALGGQTKKSERSSIWGKTRSSNPEEQIFSSVPSHFFSSVVSIPSSLGWTGLWGCSLPSVKPQS